MGESAATVDIGHQDAVSARILGHAHIDDIAGSQIGFGGRACAFDHHHIVFGAQAIQGCGDLRPDQGAAPTPRSVGQLRVDAPQQNDLAAGIGFGLEQQRVHAYIGRGTCGQGLEVLRRADFAVSTAFGGHHARVIAHVLRFERCNF